MSMHILIADDHPIFRSGLKFLLESSFPGITVTDFDNGAQVLDHLESHHPDAVFLDIDMPVRNGLDTCAEISQRFPTLRVVILSMYKDVEMVKLAFFNGAKGYLVKDNTAEELVECVNAIREGKSYLAKDVRDQNRQELSGNSQQLHIAALLSSLTHTELKVLKLVSQKYSSKEIANLLFVSVKSVENYRSRICKKLNLDARNNSLIMWVMENKSVLDKTDFN
jgi:DNA-binding NarL/FixJ family response regulator